MFPTIFFSLWAILPLATLCWNCITYFLSAEARCPSFSVIITFQQGSSTNSLRALLSILSPDFCIHVHLHKVGVKRYHWWTWRTHHWEDVLLCLFALGWGGGVALFLLWCKWSEELQDEREIRLYEIFFLGALSFTWPHALMSLLERKQPISVRNPGDYGSHTTVVSLHGHRGAAFMSLAAAGWSLKLDSVKEIGKDHREG